MSMGYSFQNVHLALTVEMEGCPITSGTYLVNDGCIRVTKYLEMHSDLHWAFFLWTRTIFTCFGRMRATWKR